MKTRFSSFDISCCVTELQKLIGLRVAQIYDVDNKTYLIRLQKPEQKTTLLIESGIRIHTTEFEWPKNIAPSGFSMKMRKHLRNKRLESLRQLGRDRIVDMQFGSGPAAYHVILELYDRGNIILTDCDLITLNILRPHTEGEAVRFAVREKYPTDRARQETGALTVEDFQKIFSTAKPGEGVKKILTPQLEYGPAIIDHVLLKVGFPPNCKLNKDFNLDQDMPRLCTAMEMAETIMSEATKQASKGYLIQKLEKHPLPDGTEKDFFSNQEFHPMVFEQHSSQPIEALPSFVMAIDLFFYQMENQKIDMKTLQMEKEAMKKLENVRKDHNQRLMALENTQAKDMQKAELITRNQELVENAILAVQSALANQLAWPEIQDLVEEAKGRDDPVAVHIKELKLAVNNITLLLSDPYADDDSTSELEPMLVDIDLDLTAHANARKYYDMKRSAAKKRQKTVESQGKALKSAEKKTKQTLKEVQVISSITKARKVYWFEKFFWFISSENYLVIGGRDQSQNEIIVKRYMKTGDIYVHADISGASSVVVKNPTGEPVPPKTLNEAGVMAVCYSVAWEAKVLTSAWWVNSDQVSKSAPAGEYLTTGSFMIRGKKNYLLPSHLIMGFGFLFRLADESAFRHKDERKVRAVEDDSVSELSSSDLTAMVEQEEEIELDDTDEEHAETNEDAEDKPVEKTVENSSQQGELKRSQEEDGDESSSGASGDESGCDEDGGKSPQKVHFPDTEVKIAVDSSNQIVLETKSTSLMMSSTGDTSQQVIYLGDDKPVILKSSGPNQKKTANKGGRGQKATKTEEEQKKQTNKDDTNTGNLKRGQKSKLKKIKDKYKDQDEEERKLIMDILQSAGSGKEVKKGKKGKEQLKNKSTLVKGDKKVTFSQPRPVQQRAEGNDSDEGEAVEEPLVNTDTDMLDLLTAIPVPEDELLFAVPVVAPYNVLLNYKYKVKLTPGTGKRGKAARTVVNMFVKDRSATQREKDLFRSVKDQDLARNLPGKVKLSAPQLKKLHK